MFNSEAAAQDGLVDLLEEWTEPACRYHLSEFGMTGGRCRPVVANSRGGSMQTNPIRLDDDELANVLRTRLAMSIVQDYCDLRQGTGEVPRTQSHPQACC